MDIKNLEIRKTESDSCLYYYNRSELFEGEVGCESEREFFSVSKGLKNGHYKKYHKNSTYVKEKGN